MVASHTVFRRKECGEFYIGSFGQNIDGRAHVVVNACGVGNQSDPLSGQLPESIVTQDFYAGFYYRLYSCRNDYWVGVMPDRRVR